MLLLFIAKMTMDEATCVTKSLRGDDAAGPVGGSR